MLNVRFIMLLLAAISPLGLPLGTAKTANAQNLINLDTSGVDEQFVNLFVRAEAFWEARVLGYSNTLPVSVQRELPGQLSIVASSADIGGGVLGFAGPTTITNVVRGNSFRSRQVAVGTTAIMTFDNAFLASGTGDEISDVIIHEMGHALGFGGLWLDNGLLQEINGTVRYTGINARRAFAAELGLPAAGFVPVETEELGVTEGEFGDGSTFVHWDNESTFFNQLDRSNRIEILTAFFIPNTERFVSQTTLASMVDLGYVVAGINEDELIDFSSRTTTSSGFPKPGINTDDPLGTPFDPFAEDDAAAVRRGPAVRSGNLFRSR